MRACGTVVGARRGAIGAGLVVAIASLGGCASHYQVTDPASGKVYYTRDIDKSGRGGHVEFTDAVSGSKVTLQSSEVKQIDSDAYEAATKKSK